MRNLLYGILTTVCVIAALVTFVVLWGVTGFFAFFGLWSFMSLSLGFASVIKWLRFGRQP